ncbi:uncharacterized protein MYCFIDRAFT_75421 [Pseudocercospora fijiensis CIRAD86]|uniref:Uncharacterized protein n=1 Tax=Pseudocercospora fijiensis (strain CIRAD86) TaxID=383855 RepID=N1Q623_PSEFD|nr:uncharacterized protein MYCFIDRAFT_75421 [Pseudocercospora fijiensis CIRAD86]EME87579.1 hypothetical protein MYCFIDRAFT_75421 [Pseudocercospora fijiensis CIRAD86]
MRWPSPEVLGDVVEETRIVQALVKMFRHDMIAQGLLYHDFPDDQDNGRRSLVVPSVIQNPFTAEGWCKWAILGACGVFRQMLDAKGGDALMLAQHVDYPIEEVSDEIWQQMEERLHELQGVSTALQTG